MSRAQGFNADGALFMRVTSSEEPRNYIPHTGTGNHPTASGQYWAKKTNILT